MFWKSSNKDKEREQDLKMAASNAALVEAAITTTQAAQDVTLGLKKRLADVIRQFESTAAILRDGLILCDENGTITTFNPSAERMFGVKASQALGSSILTLFRGETEIKCAKELWALFDNADHGDVQGIRDGATFNIRVTMSQLTRHDDSKTILLLVHEGKIRPQSYQSIFDSMMDGVVVILDQDGKMLAINPTVGRMFGYSPYELTDMNVSDLIAPRDRDRARDLCSGQLVGHHFAIDGLHVSGKTINLIFSIMEIDWEGSRSVLATIKDITEIKRVESMVAMKRENGIDMLCNLDSSRRITFVNQAYAESLGKSRRELIGTTADDHLSEADLADLTRNLGRLTVESTTARMVTNTHDWVDHALFDENGRVVEYQRTGRLIPTSSQS